MHNNMQYQLLGKADFNISRVAFGCMSLKDEYGEIEKLLKKAYEGNINLFDTADIYDGGQNEILVGKVLRTIRKNVFISTKGGNEPNLTGGGWKWNPRKEYLLKACEESLKRLRTDYIDLYQLHGGTIDDPIDEVIEAFEMLKQQGKIRFYGISSIRPNVINAYALRSNIVSVMMQYSILDRRPEETCLPFLEKQHIGVLARGTMASGLLVDKPAKEYLGYSRQDVEAVLNKVNKLSGEDRNMAQTAMHFVLHHAAITAAIIGIRTMEQLKDALHVWQTPMLSNHEVEELKNIVPVQLYADHRV